MVLNQNIEMDCTFRTPLLFCVSTTSVFRWDGISTAIVPLSSELVELDDEPGRATGTSVWLSVSGGHPSVDESAMETSHKSKFIKKSHFHFEKE